VTPPPATNLPTGPAAPNLSTPGPAGPAGPVAAEAPLVPAHTRATSKRNPKPEYPSIARRRGWEGKVLLRIDVGADGLPGKVEIAESSGREVLDQSALRTVRRWTFTPAMRGDEPVASTLTLSIVFKLD
jgi:protein TonB